MQHALAIPQHEIGAQQNKEGAVDINGGNAALGKAHEIQRQQRTGHRTDPAFAGQAAGKAPGKRHQQHTEQRAGKPPAETGHTKEGNAHHDQILAQRRMGGFIHRHLVQLFIAGTAMIDLIKIHAVELADGIGHSVLFIQQRPAAGDRHQIAVAVPESKLKHLGVFHRDSQGLARRDRQPGFAPAETGAVAQFLHKEHVAPFVGNFQASAKGDARVDPEVRRSPLHCHLLRQHRIGGVQGVLGRGGIAQVGKAQYRRSQRQPQQGPALPRPPTGLPRRDCLLCPAAGRQRQCMAVQGDIPHGKQQHNAADRFGQTVQHRYRRTGGTGQPFILGTGQGVDGCQVDETGQGHSEARRIETDIVPAGGRQQRQQHAGHHVPLVHAVPKGKDTQSIIGSQQQRREVTAAHAAHRKKISPAVTSRMKNQPSVCQLMPNRASFSSGSQLPPRAVSQLNALMEA